MRILRGLLVVWALLWVEVAVCGDVIRFMHNNLLNFGNYFDSCTEDTNNPDMKAEALRAIVDYVKPDIFTVNELSTKPVYAKLILDKSLNHTDEEWAYQAGGANSYGIGNGLFYRKDKFEVVGAKVYSIGVRYADIIRMRTRNSVFEGAPDNVTFTVIIVHLKAGSYEENIVQRGNEAKNLMNYLAANDIRGNVFLAGDFNLYGASEPAYQNMLFYKDKQVRFYDPIDAYGEWHDNIDFAYCHTQSTRSGYVECFSSGGLDDRFDFVLTSASILEGDSGIKYIEDTYKAIGNDGKHFNKALAASPVNSMYPDYLIEALTNSSDHLPVVADLELKVKFTNGIDDLYAGGGFNVSVSNPVINNRVKLSFKDTDGGSYRFEILSLSGEYVYGTDITNVGFTDVDIPAGISRGVYVGVITSESLNNRVIKKIIIK